MILKILKKIHENLRDNFSKSPSYIAYEQKMKNDPDFYNSQVQLGESPKIAPSIEKMLKKYR